MRTQSTIGRYLALALTGLLAWTGCATAEGDGEQVSTLEEMRSELSQCREARNSMETKVSSLRDRIDEMNDRIEEAESLAEEREMLYQDLERELSDLVDAGEAKITFRRGLMLVQMPNRVLFESGRYTISQRGEGALEEVANALEGVENRHIFVSGHTDDVPVSEKAVTFSNNWELSTMRALAALDVLENAGVEPIHMAAAGFSKYEPIASNESESGRSKNRRVELIVMPDLEGILQEVDTEAISDQDDSSGEQAQTERASAK